MYNRKARKCGREMNGKREGKRRRKKDDEEENEKKRNVEWIIRMKEKRKGE